MRMLDAVLFFCSSSPRLVYYLAGCFRSHFSIQGNIYYDLKVAK